MLISLSYFGHYGSSLWSSVELHDDEGILCAQIDENSSLTRSRTMRTERRREESLCKQTEVGKSKVK